MPEHPPALFERVPRGLFGPLGDLYAELYWELLAEQVDTEDAYARVYCDFVLGEAICVDDEQSLRKHKAAITDTVMVYRNHVARQTARDVFSRHYIGRAAQQRRLEEISTRLGEL